MSASEKLKALDAAFRPAAAANFGEEFDQHYARQKAQDSLRLALPQIVAVVKADEVLLAFLEAFLSHEHKQPFLTLRSLVREQRAALAALEEALS